MDKFENFWVISKNGLSLFHEDNSSMGSCKTDPDLFSGFFMAIHTMAEESMRENLKIIEFEKSKLIFVTEPEINAYFIAKVEKSKKINVVTRQINDIKNRFISEYGEQIPEWNGDTNQFVNFKMKTDE